MAYRKQKGLCFKCGEPWNKQHKCPAQVPLHIIEELLEVLDYSDSDISDDTELGSPAEDSLMAVTATPQKRRTMQFKGLVGKQEILILVDSGSIYSFLSTQMAAHLHCNSQSIPAEHFSVADGAKVQCTSMVPDFQWWTQGHSFTQDVRVLDLGSFDLILGADWLEDHSPMWIHWKLKKMRFAHMGKIILLRGIHNVPISCKPIGIHKLKGLLRRQAVTHVIELTKVFRPTAHSDVHPVLTIDSTPDHTTKHLPPVIQQVIQRYPVVFSDPNDLPPPRKWDNTIPMLPGATPVHTRAYRFPPDQKDEIEKQLKDMISKATTGGVRKSRFQDLKKFCELRLAC
ncbi:uncharacterized protein LOC120660271 isoform X2 [Panicum virgatum]|uniref:uncharacterized protein LOC120660271 isoform X2 n=1 Tax=Panicum virgatum TaxID=38727 RepID=UPI0019D67CBC|nr:uncharacterized protein LOC120660271 isoform X2 [Panicum virgatum]